MFIRNRHAICFGGLKPKKFAFQKKFSIKQRSYIKTKTKIFTTCVFFYKDSQRTNEPLHKDTHTRNEIGEVHYYFSYATSEKLKANQNSSFLT